MKKYLIVIMLCICTFTYGQVKNSKGQKMVSKVEVFNRNATTPFVVINFGYNNTKLSKPMKDKLFGIEVVVR